MRTRHIAKVSTHERFIFGQMIGLLASIEAHIIKLLNANKYLYTLQHHLQRPQRILPGPLSPLPLTFSPFNPHPPPSLAIRPRLIP